MCLYIKKTDFEVKVATEDLKCYKLMDRGPEKAYYISEYQRFVYKNGEQYKQSDEFSAAVENPKDAFGVIVHCGLFLCESITEIATRFGLENVDVIEYNSLGGGGFHSYESVSKWDIFYGDKVIDDYVAVECIIPKGSRYVVGYDTLMDRTAFYSEEIIIVGEKRFA